MRVKAFVFKAIYLDLLQRFADIRLFQVALLALPPLAPAVAKTVLAQPLETVPAEPKRHLILLILAMILLLVVTLGFLLSD